MLTGKFLQSLVCLCLLIGVAQAQTPGRPLSQSDAELYRLIFKAQARADWKSADGYIAKLDDRLLMGHVQHQRYMHPTGWRSTYAELSAWLRSYKDLPQAEEIYLLARKRRTAGQTPQRYQKRRWRAEEAPSLHPALEADHAQISQPGTVRRIEGKVRYHCSEDEPTQALNYINDRRQRSLMTRAQYNRMRSWIAESYYYNDRLDKAERIATEVIHQDGETAPMAYWIAGLIHFRAGNYKEAAWDFSTQAEIEWQGDELRAGAAFWAARSALAAGEETLVIPNLEIAATKPFTFYGQLALGQLGQSAPFHFEQKSPSATDWEDLFEAAPRIKRAAALAQIGQIHRAQEELRWAHGEVDARLNPLLLAAAYDLDLPSAAVTMALASGADETPGSPADGALYPLPSFSPNGGFTIDQAVLFGIIRQESKFMTEAESRVGARGLMQLMPRTASYVSGDRSLQYRSQGKRLFDAGYNMQLGQSYIDYLLKGSAKGDMFEMALSYNWGPGNLRRFKEKSGITDQFLLLESIPNKEARDFVEHVMSNVWVYRARLNQPAPARDAAAAGGRPIYRSVDY